MSILQLRFKGFSNFSPILPGSKSESNRALILKLVSGDKIEISNLSKAKDTVTLERFTRNQSEIFDAGDAGTTFRFFTAYMALTGKKGILTGSERMKERPIGILVDALVYLGAEIEYLERKGFPPLKFNGFYSNGKSEIEIDATISSQYISALMMAGPILPNGIKIILKGDTVASWPYLELTWNLMERLGIKGTFNKSWIYIPNQEFQKISLFIESDWSAAAYWYSFLAVSPIGTALTLNGLFENSFQGDSAIQSIYRNWGVSTKFNSGDVLISKEEDIKPDRCFEYDFCNIPDQGQTLIALCAATGVEARFSGLQSLAIKETNRLLAMQTELKKVGVKIEIDEKKGFCYVPGRQNLIEPNLPFKTYNDHRMAMSLSIFSNFFEKGVSIENPEVVEKSYPDFWIELEKSGYELRFS
jgi:3-phosphoshikimate 1-carboxyvinyltransferase